MVGYMMEKYDGYFYLDILRQNVLAFRYTIDERLGDGHVC